MKTHPLLPLKNVRVIELGAAIASPYQTSMYADMGAEVIKMETEKRPDNIRYTNPWVGEKRDLDASYYFNKLNRNKLGLLLDLRKEEAKGIFKQIVSVTDIVVENFAAGTMDSLGLGYNELRKYRPDLIMISLSGFGATGPDRSFVAYGPVLEGVGGIMNLNGWKDGPPEICPFSYTDYVSALYASQLVMSALYRRRITGQGLHADISEAQVATNAIPATFYDGAVNGRMWSRNGSRTLHHAIHEFFPCKGNDDWIAISIRDEAEWQAFCKATGDAEWTRRPEFATEASRLQRQDELERLVGQWTATITRDEAFALLQRHGVSAGPMYSIKEVTEGKHTIARKTYLPDPHPITKDRRIAASTIRLAGAPREIFRPAPLWGQHNPYVSLELLGFAPAEAERLKASGVFS